LIFLYEARIVRLCIIALNSYGGMIFIRDRRCFVVKAYSHISFVKDDDAFVEVVKHLLVAKSQDFSLRVNHTDFGLYQMDHEN